MGGALSMYLDAIRGFGAVVDRAEPARWDDQSPCELWTARAVVNHMAFMAEIVKGMASGKPAIEEGEGGYSAPGVPGWRVRHELLQLAINPAIGPTDDPKVVWSQRRDALIEAVNVPGAIQAASMSPWGHTSTELYLPLVAGDAVVHTWDLATALGQDPVIEPALAEAALGAWAAAESAGSPVRQPYVLGRAHPTDADDALSRLLSHTGRRIP